MTTDRHIVITGHGRSGSNLLLDILDCSPETLCRNELNRLRSGALAALPDGFFTPTNPDLTNQWSQAVRVAARCQGARDRLDQHGKRYFRSKLRTRIGQRVIASRQARRLLSLVSSDLRRDEWPCPGFYIDQLALSRTVPVFKILLASGWIVDTHATHREQKVLHIIREPTGFIRSWLNRYVATRRGGAVQVFADNLETLPRILRHFGEDPACYHTFSESALIESELWRWRYVNEILISQLRSSDRYMTVVFDDISQPANADIDGIFSFCGIEMTDDARARISLIENKLFSRPHARSVDAQAIGAAARRVLKGSALEAYLV